MVALDNNLRQLGISVYERTYGFLNLVFYEPAHVKDFFTKVFQLLFVFLIGVGVVHGLLRLTESPRDVIFGLALLRQGKQLAGLTKFYQLSQIEKSREVGDPGGLLHIVGD